ncbi:MAG: hypothetical protein ACYS8W_16480 [Planctomycetota bacterium]|jgi:hypothetical protein
MENESKVFDPKFISIPRRSSIIPKLLAVYMLLTALESLIIIIPWIFNYGHGGVREHEIIMGISGSITSACLLFSAISLFVFYSFGRSLARFAITVYILNFTFIYFFVVPRYWTGAPVFSYIPHLLKHINIGAAVWLITELIEKKRNPGHDADDMVNRRLLVAVLVLIVLQGAWTHIPGYFVHKKTLSLYYLLAALYAAAFLINGRLVYALAFIPFLVLFILSGDYMVLLMGIVILSKAFWDIHLDRYPTIILLVILCGILSYKLYGLEIFLIRQYQAGGPGAHFFLNFIIYLLDFLKEIYPLGLTVFILFRRPGKVLFDEVEA